MKSNCDVLGNLIQLEDCRNVGLVSEQVLGISIDKSFMPSVANIIGTDLSKYKLISKGLFACNPMHVGRDERLPVALYTADTPALVSPAYFMFSIKDKSILNEEYLMLWFRRLEFDRNCWFRTDGSVRGGISWEDICRIELPIPAYEDQVAIVNAYTVIADRIALKKQINDNLLDTAQTIIKDSMADNFEKSTVGDLIELFDSIRKPMSSLERSGMERIYPYYGAAALMDYVDDYIFDGIFGLLGEDGTVIDDNGYPTMQYVWGKFWVNNHAHIFQGKNGYSTELAYLILKNTIVRDAVTGAVQLKINQENLRKLPIQLPVKDTLKSIEAAIQPLLRLYRNNYDEILQLKQLTDIILEKMSA